MSSSTDYTTASSLPPLSATPVPAAPHTTYYIAASSSGKGRRFRSENVFNFWPRNDALGVQRGNSQSEKRKNRPDSGQDAFFAASVGPDGRATAFGIADGVGSWVDHGVDPADFSHGMCDYMAQTAMGWSGGRLEPQILLDIGYRRTLEDPEILGGGTTACIGVAEDDGKMHIANLGDSGFLQLRLGAVHHYSNPQTHAFNTPYQMSITPPEILRQTQTFGGVPINDPAEMADIAYHMLHHGDVLVLATDGVWDNLNSQDVLAVVTTEMRRFGAWVKSAKDGFIVTDKLATLTQPEGLGLLHPQHTLQGAVAVAIAREAKIQSLNHRRDGPFAREVQKYEPSAMYHGGKIDDISVMVVIPVEENKISGNMKARL